MDFKRRELRFGVKDKGSFNEMAVREALQARGFPEVELKSGPP
jgi:hypothetical protein